MFDNKYLVNLYVLSLGKEYEVYLPVNEKIGNITRLMKATLFDSVDFEKNNALFNVDSGITYEKNTLVRDTDIKNGSKLILL